MSYHWNWGVFLSPVSTGEPTTYLGWLISGFWVTVTVSLASWVVALVVGSLFGILRTVPNHNWPPIGTVYVAIFRNIPLLVQFFIWYLVIPELLPASIGNWFKQLPPNAQFYSSSIFCLGFFTGARVCEQVRSGIAALPRGQRAAGLAMGFTEWQTYRYILMPVAYRIIVPPLTSEFLNVFKNSAVASTIGLLELSAQARQLVDYTAQSYESFIAVTLAYMLINLIVMQLMRGSKPRPGCPATLEASDASFQLERYCRARCLRCGPAPSSRSRSRCSRSCSAFSGAPCSRCCGFGIKPLEWFAKAYVTLFRSIPLVMVLLWFFLIVPQVLQNVLGLSPDIDIRLASAMVAFSLFEAAYYSEIIRAGIQAVSRGQVNAAFALGMTLPAVDAPHRAAAGVSRDGAAAAHAGYRVVPGYVACVRYQPRGLFPHGNECGRPRRHDRRDGAVRRRLLFRGVPGRIRSRQKSSEKVAR